MSQPRSPFWSRQESLTLRDVIPSLLLCLPFWARPLLVLSLAGALYLVYFLLISPTSEMKSIIQFLKALLNQNSSPSQTPWNTLPGTPS